MAYTISLYVWHSARLKAAKKLLAELISQHSKTAFFVTEHARLLSEIQELETVMKRYERYNDNKGRG